MEDQNEKSVSVEELNAFLDDVLSLMETTQEVDNSILDEHLDFVVARNLIPSSAMELGRIVSESAMEFVANGATMFLEAGNKNHSEAIIEQMRAVYEAVADITDFTQKCALWCERYAQKNPEVMDWINYIPDVDTIMERADTERVAKLIMEIHSITGMTSGPELRAAIDGGATLTMKGILKDGGISAMIRRKLGEEK